MFENNRLTRVLGIKYPIIQGGMAGVSESVLAAAVSEAGGLGVIGSGFASPDWLREEVKKTKSMTSKPFGVNLLMQNPNVAELVKIIIEEKVPVVFTGGGNPLPILPYLKSAGVKVVPVVPTIRLANKMEQNGVDAVVVEGLESGGHIGENTTFCLVSQASESIKTIPVVAAGGIYDGKTFAAAMVLGAEGVQIGTRFMVASECQIHENYKQAIINATDEDVTVIGRFTGHPIRAIKNRLTDNLKKMEDKNPFPEEINSERFAGSKGTANIDLIPLLSGIAAGGIKETMNCKEIIEEIANDAKAILEKGPELIK